MKPKTIYICYTLCFSISMVLEPCPCSVYISQASQVSVYLHLLMQGQSHGTMHRLKGQSHGTLHRRKGQSRGIYHTDFGDTHTRFAGSKTISGDSAQGLGAVSRDSTQASGTVTRVSVQPLGISHRLQGQCHEIQLWVRDSITKFCIKFCLFLGKMSCSPGWKSYMWRHRVICNISLKPTDELIGSQP